MNVFISWSGARSRAVAEALRAWLPRVIQAARPWTSDEDISAGSRWLSEIQAELSKASLGIICVTPENQSTPWLLFEAGALSKALTESHVCPLLLDLAPSQLVGPLAQFQASTADREGIERIVATLNRALGENGVAQEDLREIVDVWWPRLQTPISHALGLSHLETRKRPVEDILEEVVANTREQLRRENIRMESGQERDKKIDEFLDVVRSTFGAIQHMQERLSTMSTRASPPEELVKLMRNTTVDVGQLQNMLGSLKDLSDSQKVFDERILKGTD